MSKNPLTTAEISRIKALLLSGQSHNAIARQVGRAQSTISDLARREGIAPPVNRIPQTAIDRRKEFALEARLEATGELMAKVRELALSATSAREAKEAATAWGILVDKMLLMEGLPTNRSETHTSRPGALNLEEEFAKWAEPIEHEIRRDNV